jgi:hypothetical protein
MPQVKGPCWRKLQLLNIKIAEYLIIVHWYPASACGSIKQHAQLGC